MDGYDIVDKHRVVSACFSNVVYLKKWYIKTSLGITDLYLLQGFSVLDLSVDEFRTGGRSGK